jgi:hypothetical protein
VPRTPWTPARRIPTLNTADFKRYEIETLHPSAVLEEK